jgi:hypothetical protein
MTRSSLIAGLMIATVAGLALSAPASAKSATEIRREALEKREAAQIKAIEAGRRDGSLTWWEKVRLMREERRAERLEAQALSDGRITKSEYFAVKGALQDEARHIDADRHNDAVRGWWWRTFIR